MKYYMLIATLYFLSGCASQGNVSSTATNKSSLEEKARNCAMCHDPNAKTEFVDAPALTGRSYDELVSAMKKVHEYYPSQPSLMHDFSESDIHYIATYFSNIK